MARQPQVRETLRQLSQQLRQMGAVPDWTGDADTLRSTGLRVLDEFLPAGGVAPGTLLECLSEGAGTGAGTLAFVAAATIAGEQRCCVAIDPQQTFYPPAVPQWRTALDRLVVVHPPDEASTLWAWEQALRCTGVAVVVGWLGKVQPQAYRRLKLAAEIGRSVSWVLRPAQFVRQPLWADIRLVVRPALGGDLSLGIGHLSLAIDPRLRTPGPNPQPPIPNPRNTRLHKEAQVQGRRVSIELIHAPGVLTRNSLELELDDETGAVRLAASVASTTLPLRETGT